MLLAEQRQLVPGSGRSTRSAQALFMSRSLSLGRYGVCTYRCYHQLVARGTGTRNSDGSGYPEDGVDDDWLSRLPPPRGLVGGCCQAYAYIMLI